MYAFSKNVHTLGWHNAGIILKLLGLEQYVMVICRKKSNENSVIPFFVTERRSKYSLSRLQSESSTPTFPWCSFGNPIHLSLFSFYWFLAFDKETSIWPNRTQRATLTGASSKTSLAVPHKPDRARFQFRSYHLISFGFFGSFLLFPGCGWASPILMDRARMVW